MILRRAALLLTVAAATLFVCERAEAHWTNQQVEALALLDAEEYWQGPHHNGAPCNGDIRFVLSPEIELSKEQKEDTGPLAGASMWASWSDVGTYVDGWSTWTGDWSTFEGPQVDAGNFRHCVLHMSEPEWGGQYLGGNMWPKFSTGVAHELEHFEDRWQSEPTVDNGSLKPSEIPLTAVNYPGYTCYNEPWSAKMHHPPGAWTARESARYTSCGGW